MEEAIKYGALPSTLNEGIMKLIHKRGPKEELGNWRPLTMPTKSLQKSRLQDFQATWRDGSPKNRNDLLKADTF